MELKTFRKKPTCRVLIADTPEALPLVSRLLGEEFEISRASTSDDAERLVEQSRPDVVIVGYHFDGARPYRLLQNLRDGARAVRVAALLVRALPVLPQAMEEKGIEDTYRQMGADGYLVLDKGARGDAFKEVSERLRSAVWRLCPRTE
jgi:PleD family two-component response regulator